MNTEQIKKDFPILENRKITYLDSGATTQKPIQVIDKVEEFYKTNNANQNLTVIVNKTGREFDWYELTGSTKTNPGKFVTGLVLHQSGNIEIVDK